MGVCACPNIRWKGALLGVVCAFALYVFIVRTSDLTPDDLVSRSEAPPGSPGISSLLQSLVTSSVVKAARQTSTASLSSTKQPAAGTSTAPRDSKNAATSESHGALLGLTTAKASPDVSAVVSATARATPTSSAERWRREPRGRSTGGMPVVASASRGALSGGARASSTRSIFVVASASRGALPGGARVSATRSISVVASASRGADLGGATVSATRGVPVAVSTTPGALVGGAVCNASSWAAAYSRHHAAMLSDASSPRFLVSVAALSGLADRLLAQLTHFYWAVLSGRALQLMEWGTVARLGAALQPRCVQWDVPRDAHPREAWYHLFNVPLCSTCLYNATTLNETWGTIPTSRSMSSIVRLYRDSNMALWPPELQDIPYVCTTGTGGRTHILWKNSHHLDELRNITLQENAIKTAWDFLFAPSNATVNAMQPYTDLLDGAFVVAIHVRTGDSTLAHPEQTRPNLEAFSDATTAHFKCAEELSKNVEGRVRWFLASDSLELRRAAKSKYGELLVTNIESKPRHISHQVETDPFNERAMISSVADLLLLAKGQLHVLTGDSGYGRLGALLSNASGAHIAWGSTGAKCAAELRTRLDGSVLTGWSGVR